MRQTTRAIQTVFVVDDDPGARRAVEQLARAMGCRAEAFVSARALYDCYHPSRSGCVVLDVTAPRRDGLELYGRMVREGKRLPAIFVTAHADVGTAVAAMKTGAIEFLEKPFDEAVLRDRIERALRLDAQWRERQSAYDAIDAKILLLTERERETLELVIAGDSNKTMAEKLFISERAVEMRRAGMMRKLGVKSTAELLELAITHRVLSEVRRASSLETFMPDVLS